jgi:hypothetical protein
LEKEPQTREYPHTHMGVHEDRGDFKKGEEDIRNSINIGSFSNPEAVDLNLKKKNGLRKIFKETSKGKMKIKDGNKTLRILTKMRI